MITHGKVHDVHALDRIDIDIEAGARCIIDGGYLDFELLYTIQKASAFFITRAKSNSDFKHLCSQP